MKKQQRKKKIGKDWNEREGRGRAGILGEGMAVNGEWWSKNGYCVGTRGAQNASRPFPSKTWWRVEGRRGGVDVTQVNVVQV